MEALRRRSSTFHYADSKGKLFNEGGGGGEGNYDRHKIRNDSLPGDVSQLIAHHRIKGNDSLWLIA